MHLILNNISVKELQSDCIFSKQYLRTEKAKNVKFSTKALSSTRMMCALEFLEKKF